MRPDFFKCKLAKGFSLIELLVVIAIIGILSTIGIGSFMSSQMKARDSTRKSDISQIQKALEMYYNDNGMYPATIPSGGVWQDGVDGNMYMREVPEDPKYGAYLYEPTIDNSGYRIFAGLENTNDPQYQVIAGKSCGPVECSYQAASVNLPDL